MGGHSRPAKDYTPDSVGFAANLRTKLLEFRGFDSSIILILRGGIPMPIGNVPESLSQAILVGIILVGRLGVPQVAFAEHGALHAGLWGAIRDRRGFRSGLQGGTGDYRAC